MKENHKNPSPQLYIDDFTPIAVIDLSGIIKWSNNYPRLPVGVSIKEIIPDIILDGLFDMKKQISACVNGINYLINSYPSDNNQEAMLVLENNVILEKRRLKFHVEEYENLQMLLDSPYDALVYVDEKGIIRYVNNAFANYNKLTIDKIIGRKHEDFPIDKNLDRILKTQDYEPLTLLNVIGNNKMRKMIASRRPVYRNGEFAGAFGQYFSIDPKDVNVFGESYIGLLARLQTRDIMFNVTQSIIELTHNGDFNKTNATWFGINIIIGNSPVIQELKERVLIVSDSPSSVLLTGESGTGKELFAKAIHFHGNRSSHHLVKVNCAAIPENLLEAELFGYVDGAFTGARKGGKMGKFELANKGTIFLDEIGDMPLAMQAKLLRVLQEREIERIGSELTIPIDVRVISATNKDLQAMINNGSFREDLYYRLNVVKFHIPPLRERMSDVPEIINYLINELNSRLGRNLLSVSPEAIELFLAYNWPGNVRELVNVLEGAMNFCRSSVLKPADLPFFLHSHKIQNNEHEPDSLQTKLDFAERTQLLSVLKQCNGNRKAAAAVLEVSKATMYRLLKKHNLV